MTQFHSDEYVDFLSRVTPTNMNSYIKEQHKCTCSFGLLLLIRMFTLLTNCGCLVVPSIVPFTTDTDNVGDDCPVFDGLFDYCSISAGGSMGAFTCNSLSVSEFDDAMRCHV